MMGDRFYGSPELIAWCVGKQWHWRLHLKGCLLWSTIATAGANVLPRP